MNAPRGELVRVGWLLSLIAASISVGAFVWPWLVPIELGILLAFVLACCGTFFQLGRASALNQYADESRERSRRLAEALAKYKPTK